MEDAKQSKGYGVICNLEIKNLWEDKREQICGKAGGSDMTSSKF